ncbi:MAG TPA: XTP/dITP diphosphatase [Candidatus Binatia bacterium]|nr:XTP/dITP diphosphatase [Candidatus Binatia bacterium]
MIDLLVATTNSWKLAEIKAFLKHLPVHIVSLNDLQNPPAVVEDGRSFEENALKKARTLAEWSGYWALADDSGLEVDALNGKPGILSARFSGVEGDDAANNSKLIEELRDVAEEKRTARFVCVLAACAPRSRGGKQCITQGSCEGFIGFAAKGKNGFGYDPLFFFPPLNKTFGEIDQQTKITVSHRGKALKKLVEVLPACFDGVEKP